MNRKSCCQQFHIVDDSINTFLVRYTFFLERYLQDIYNHQMRTSLYNGCLSQLIQSFFALTHIMNLTEQRDCLLAHVIKKVPFANRCLLMNDHLFILWRKCTESDPTLRKRGEKLLTAIYPNRCIEKRKDLLSEKLWRNETLNIYFKRSF